MNICMSASSPDSLAVSATGSTSCAPILAERTLLRSLQNSHFSQSEFTWNDALALQHLDERRAV